MRQEPDICIYHGPGCPDGFGAAWAVWKAFPNCKFIPKNYGEPPPDVTGLHVVIVDFSFPLLEMQVMASVAASLTILDHHKTAAAVLGPFLQEAYATEGGPIVRGEFDMTRSGALLAWLWFHDGPPSNLVRYLSAYDLWKHDSMPDVRPIAASIHSYPHDFEVYSRLSVDLATTRFHHHVSAGTAILRARQQIIYGLVKTARFMTIGGFQVPVVNAPKAFGSDVGHELALIARIEKSSTDAGGVEHMDVVSPPFGATYFDYPEYREFSLRSTDEQEDVSAIAASYGGGGHRNAAGFKMPLGWEGDDVQVTSIRTLDVGLLTEAIEHACK